MPTPVLSNQGAIVSLEIVRAVAWAYTISIRENGSPVNVTGRTYAAQIRTTSGALAAAATCVIVDPANGKISVSFTAAATAALTAGTQYVFSMEQTASGLTTELLRGDVSVYGDITQ